MPASTAPSCTTMAPTFLTILQSYDPTTAPQPRVQEGKHQGLHCKVPLTIPQKKKKKKEKKGNQNREGGTRFGDVIQYSVGQHLSTSIQATHHPGSHQGLFLHTHSPSFLQKNKNLAPKSKTQRHSLLFFLLFFFSTLCVVRVSCSSPRSCRSK